MPTDVIAKTKRPSEAVDIGVKGDPDQAEIREWLDALEGVLQTGGPERARSLLTQLKNKAVRQGVEIPFTANTPYINTIPPDRQPPFPGSREIERRIKSLARWNAMAMVVRANKHTPGIGGHISTYASAARCWKSASTTSSAAPMLQAAAIKSIFRATLRRGFTPARFSKTVCPPRSWKTSAASWLRAGGCRRTRTPG
jgi:hypothetical protein